MPKHQETCSSQYNADQLFDLVADIAKYPEFLPWCVAAEIIKQEDNIVYAELVVNFKFVQERYISKVTLDRANYSVTAEMVEGPFEHLYNEWKFTPGTENTEIQFMLDFQFKSALLETLLNGFFGQMVSKMTNAFRDRAHTLYGTNGTIA